jgi:hypothetical protein
MAEDLTDRCSAPAPLSPEGLAFEIANEDGYCEDTELWAQRNECFGGKSMLMNKTSSMNFDTDRLNSPNRAKIDYPFALLPPKWMTDPMGFLNWTDHTVDPLTFTLVFSAFRFECSLHLSINLTVRSWKRSGLWST